MRIYELLEAVTDTFLYHGVRNGEKAFNILKSGVIRPSVSDIERDFFNDTHAVISASRNQFLRYPAEHAVAQFVLDRDALKRAGFYVKPWSFRQFYKKTDNKITATGHPWHKAETEERIWHPKGIGIPVKPPFIVAIQIDPELTPSDEFVELAKQKRIPITVMKKTKTPVKSVEPPEGRPDPTLDPAEFKVKITGQNPTTTYYSLTYKDRPIDPFSNKTNKELLDKVLKQIVDRVKQGKGFNDIILQYDAPARSWEQGSHRLRSKDLDNDH